MSITKQQICDLIKGEKKAQYELYRQHYSLLLSICRRYKNNKEDAEELLNLGFLKILMNIEKYSEPTPFIPWMRRIMLNTIIDEFRKGKSYRALFEQMRVEQQEFYGEVDINTAVQEMDYQSMMDLLCCLPEATKKVFNLYAIDGFNHQEIADALQISVGTSKWHVSAAREKLQKLIIEKHPELVINSKVS